MSSTNLSNLAKIGQLDPVVYSKDLVDSELVSEAALQECLKQAQALLARVESVLSNHGG